MNNLSSLGERIKQIRKIVGVNQADFARKIGLETATGVSNYEKNKRTPEINILVKIAEAGKVSLDWLLTGEGPKYKKGVRSSDKPDLTSPDDALYNNVSEDSVLGVAEPDGPPYGQPAELGRLKSQLERVYKGKDRAAVERLKGFLAALDPGEE